MTAAGPRFGVWANVYGSWAALRHPEDPLDASWERNQRLVLLAEQLGFDSTLVAQHEVNPFGGHLDQLEAWTSSAALAALTERIEIITAIKPLLYHPVVLAKQALQIEDISHGRFAINLVNAWYKPEIEPAGIAFPEHDERYAYGAEWLTIVRGLLAGEEVTFHGRYFDVDGYSLRPRDRFRERPTIYVGGESDPAKDLAADQADVWFLNGQPPHEIDRLLAEVGSRGRDGAVRTPLRIGLAAFVIARETDEEAEEALAQAWRYAAQDEPELTHLYSSADPKAVMFQTFQKYPAIGTNGGTAAGLVGSYGRVAERIRAFHAQGVELFMLQFQPFEAEMARFAEHVIPRVRRAAVPA
ncbi:LLM class flavin-dependent oxidoreductase [Actinomycetospora sp. TBRC 11914]|uniref:LLM class flavin-dependent oxidoreductase n=1 Tax=Actinomycetospora sp. TBRC 11914 TaxID=2729387 RepID=UPI00145D9A85|nr:LLM class flavin-dependent oxidoreductase [Actinomycetospora sp. TBRC 11914]NMO91492.1 LLM class flavin-dependent oxidoreductase [Actinomycetospora sp. TBRC 11914]